ncbi:MAG: hypothetical protein QFF03_16580 [Pseudomonadota bacterium]|nr:hypothetical protein [Pseudomonadota bacterium]
MTGHLLKALALNEVRLRMRRISTIVALLAVVAISWAMIEDPASGNALLVVGNARVLYTSSTLALGSAALASMLFGLGGFFLVRGRIAEDIRTGAGSVIAATPVGNALFLAGRWLGGVAYLGLLLLAFMGTMMVCHALRGDGPIEPLVYLSTYCLILLPMAFFAASCAILFDSWAPLMGKGGDVLYFFLWVGQISMVALVETSGQRGLPWTLFDFTGTTAVFLTLGAHFDTTHLSLGLSPFDARLAPLLLPAEPWSMPVVLMRCAAGVLALLPLAPAVLLFHRFSPDKVKLSRSRQRRSPLALVDGALRRLSPLVRPLFALAARLPRRAGQVLADVALALAASPSSIAVLVLALAASLVSDMRVLGPLLTACVAWWGIQASDMSTRDFQAGAEAMSAAVEGGATRRYLRQYVATVLLGFMFMGVIALRFALHDPLRGAAVAGGILALAALAQALGRCSRTPRAFMSLFLFGLYVAVNAVKVPMVDAVGFNGVANAHSVLAYLAIGMAALAGGYAWNRRD